MERDGGNAAVAVVGLGGAALARWVALAARLLTEAAPALNGLNVFPVADADTGSNLAATMRGAASAIGALSGGGGYGDGAGGSGPGHVREHGGSRRNSSEGGADAALLMAAAAQGALRAARGNSGVILSEWLRGFATAVASAGSLAGALGEAAGAAFAAVAKPAPGTILTSARAAADAAQAAGPGANAPAVVGAALAAARKAAQASPQQLAALARAGVLDAGACGLVLVLAALDEVVSGEGEALEAGSVGPAAIERWLGFDPNSAVVVAGVAPDEWDHNNDGDEDGFEVMFTLARPAGATEFATGELAASLRGELSAVGDSVVVVGGAAIANQAGESVWHGHVHVAELGPALELVERWRELAAVAAIQVRHLAVPGSEVTIWVVAEAVGLIAEFARAGAVVLVPSAGLPLVTEVADAVSASPSGSNLVLVPPELVGPVSEAIPVPDAAPPPGAHGAPSPAAAGSSIDAAHENGDGALAGGNGAMAKPVVDLVLGPGNDAGVALVLLAVAEQTTPSGVLAAAEAACHNIVTAASANGAAEPPHALSGASLDAVVAVTPGPAIGTAVAAMRRRCEEAGGELLEITSSDTGGLVQWAAERGGSHAGG